MTTNPPGDVLPSFDKPPINEVVFGLQFQPLTEMVAAHAGQFWQKINKEYPNVKEATLLATPIEKFDDDIFVETPVDVAEITAVPRMWFESPTGTNLVQLQRNHLIYNWRRQGDEDEYPRYDALRKIFEERLGDFRAFVGEAALGEILPLQYELTYSNRISYNEHAKDIGEVGNIFTGVNTERTEGKFLPALTGLNWLDVYSLENQKGRLRTTISEVVNQGTKEHAIQFQLTVRGISEDTSDHGMWGWFENAHKWIVRGFCDMTTEEFQQEVWGRTE